MRTALAFVLLSAFSAEFAFTQEVLFQQPPSSSSGGEPFLLANQLPTHPDIEDFGRTKVWDNFGLDHPVEVTGVRWSGAFDGPFNPRLPRPELDFRIEIFANEHDSPSLDTAVATWILDAGSAATDDGVDVRSIVRPDETVIRGGVVVDFSADPLPAAQVLDVGEYWLSITAIQTFPSPDPSEDPVNGFFDPGWGWLFGEGTDAKAYQFDAFVDEAEPGREVAVTLAFALLGVPLDNPVRGDFDDDALLGVTDIDLLSLAVRDQSTDVRFDLTNDGLVDAADRDEWIDAVFGTLRGDADLDRRVGFPDFLRLSAAFSGMGGWGQGDFDGDGRIAFADFLVLSQQFGNSVPTATLSAVPEILDVRLPIVAVLFLLGDRRQRTKPRTKPQTKPRNGACGRRSR